VKNKKGDNWLDATLRRFGTDEFDVMVWLAGLLPRRILYWCRIAGDVKFSDAVHRHYKETGGIACTADGYVKDFLLCDLLFEIEDGVGRAIKS
jgi:hypothetical protein